MISVQTIVGFLWIIAKRNRIFYIVRIYIQNMNLISAFYYYLECSVIYVQQRVWGRFYNESLALKIVNATTAILWLIFMLYIVNSLHWSVDYAIVLSLIPVIPWAWYHLSNTYRKKGIEDKKQDFGRLPSIIRWIYISYSTILTIIAPLAIVGMIIWSFVR